MKQTKNIMGMPITVDVIDDLVTKKDLKEVFDYFKYIDQKFSTYKNKSEISLINQGKLEKSDYSQEMKTVFELSKETKRESDGFFDINFSGKIDPSGLVKGWAIFNAAQILEKKGFKNFYINAGGDIQVKGKNKKGLDWTIGIKNPFNQTQIVKALTIKNQGVATSGTYIRGQHIFRPNSNLTDEIISLTVIGPNIYEADRFATAAFAMGKQGIHFIEKLKGFEGYLIDVKGIATYTSGFEKYTLN